MALEVALELQDARAEVSAGEVTPRRIGRPRSLRADEAIQQAVLTLLAEMGYTGTSMDEVARRARVGKDTLYRRWPSKAALVREAISRMAEEQVRVRTSDDPRSDLVTYLNEIVQFTTAGSFGRIVAGLVGEASRNPELARAFQSFWDSRRRTAANLLLRARAAAGKAPVLDLELELDLLLAPIYYRLLLTGAPLDGDLVDKLVDKAISARATKE
jgi:AcrR family transcriptional regulator